MQTYTHFITSIVLAQALKNRTKIPVHTKAFLFGSVLPDLGLGLLTVGFLLKRRINNEEAVWCGDEFNEYYFNDPLWIIGHNLLHSPFCVAIMIVLGYYIGKKRNKRWGWSLLWFGVGCGIHSSVDILTHHNDGPLLLFPFEWQTRFNSIISYWDHAHGARIVAPLEHLIDFILLLRILCGVLNERRKSVIE